MRKSITILGAGAWGTAIAHLLATNGHEVTVWCHEPELTEEINQNHTNSFYLPDVELPYNIRATASMQEAFDGAHIIFEAVPVKYLRTVLEHARGFVNKDQIWVILSKGIEQESFLVPSQILDEVMNFSVKKVAVCGPSFARDLVEAVPTGVIVASDYEHLAQVISSVLINNYFSCTLSGDLLGVQLAAALKNVFALTIGIAFGTQARDNTVALLFTRALAEMGKVVQAFGGQQETVYSLAGVGDLVLTCYGSLSKNFTLGKLLGQGTLLQDISSEGVFPEGINTIQSLIQLAEKKSLKLPIVQGTYGFIFEYQSFTDLVAGVLR